MNRRSLLLAFIPVLAAAALLLMSGKATPPSAPPETTLRIVSLAPSVTEILFALDMGDEIVGATKYCDYPAEAQRILRAGAMGKPNVEVVLSLHPDMVIGVNLSDDGIVILRKTGIPVHDLKMTNFEEMFDGIRTIGKITGKSARADEIIAEMQREFDAVAAQNAATPARQRPKVFIEIWHNPLKTAGGTSFMDEVVQRAGGVNVAHDLAQPYPTIGPEHVLAWNPDVILLGHLGQGADTVSQLRGRIGWSGIAAIKTGRIITDIPSDHLQRPGPRLVKGVKALALRLRGEAAVPAQKVIRAQE